MEPVTHTRVNRGVCSSKTTVRLSASGVIEDVAVSDGCDGNLKGLCALLRGRAAAEAIGLLAGIKCENKPTSCPAQIAECLEEAMAAQGMA